MSDLERKFCAFGDEITLVDGAEIEGYASLFGACDHGGDVVAAGAYGASLAELAAKGARVKMLWQHDPTQPIGVWDDVREDAKGLYVRGRILTEIEKGREAAALIEAGALDGLSIGYRTKESVKDAQGRRVLKALDLWEVSLVTFPMLSEARVGAKGDALTVDPIREMAAALRAAAEELAGG